MASHPSFDVSTVIEQQQGRRFAATLILAMAVMMLTEGYDLGAMAFAAPALSRAWQLGRGALGPVFGAFVFGTMIGAFVLGYLGDVIGRKRTIVIGSFVLSMFTFAASRATQIEHLLILRFLAGIGIGGVVPNAIAYMSEFAPKRWRATWVTLMYTGYTIGSGIGGLVAASLVPRFGWQVVFVIGGIAPLVTGSMLWLSVPESIRFLTLKGDRNDEVARIVRRLAPSLELAPHTRFVIGQELQGSARSRQSASLALLFSGRPRALTPVLWGVYVANSMALFFLNSWLPMLIESVGLPPQRAALVSAMFQLGGTLGGLALMRFVDTRGAVIISVLPLIGTPLVALLGVGMPEPMLIAAVFLIGFTVVGTQFGLNAVAALVYPTALRAKGTGAAVGIQKIGAIAGPMFGGMLLAAHLPVRQLFYLGAVPVALVAVLAFVLGRLHRPGDDGIAPGEPGARAIPTITTQEQLMPLDVIPFDPLRPDFVGLASGIDLAAPLAPATARAVDAAMNHYAVLVFRGQPLTPDKQLAFARALGPLDIGFKRVARPHARLDQQELADISNLDESGQIADRAHRRVVGNLANQLWHSDSSFQKPSARYSMLHAVVVPAWGGATEFADMRAAWDALPERDKQDIDGLQAEHYALHSRFLLGDTDYNEAQRNTLPPVQWPLVRTHAGSGRRHLFIGAHTTHVVGQTIAEGRVLLMDLLEHATQRQFVYSHEWQPGDLVIWDNRCTLHRGRRHDLSVRRELRRATTLDADHDDAGYQSQAEVA